MSSKLELYVATILEDLSKLKTDRCEEERGAKLTRSLLPQGKIYVIYRNPDYILMPEDKIVTEKEIEELATEGFLSSLPPLEIKRQGKEPVCLQLVIPFSIENKIHNLRISNCKIIEEEQKDKLK